MDAVLLAWFVVTALSGIYVAWDAFTNNPEMTVMKWGWILVTLYLGPASLFLYIMSCKEPAPGTHEEFINPLWKQALGSTIHCVAGDATGIIVAATITAVLGLPMWIDLIVEYVGGFAFGLLIFQSLFMRDMMGGSYRKTGRIPRVNDERAVHARRTASRQPGECCTRRSVAIASRPLDRAPTFATRSIWGSSRSWWAFSSSGRPS